MTDRELLDELLEIERAGWRALSESAGDRFFGDLMTDDAVMVLANGTVLGRDEVVTALADAPAWRSFELSDPRLVRAGADTAAVVYIGSTERADGESAFVGAMSSVYQRTPAGWRLVLYQQTAMGG